MFAWGHGLYEGKLIFFSQHVAKVERKMIKRRNNAEHDQSTGLRAILPILVTITIIQISYGSSVSNVKEKKGCNVKWLCNDV